MDSEFALRISDIRLLQTLRLLEGSFADHPHQSVVADVLAALNAARTGIEMLGVATPDECCA